VSDSSGTPGQPISIGVKVLGGGAALLFLFLAVGFFLPGTWAAQRTVRLDAPPEAVFPLVDAPDAWRRWTAWPDSGLSARGPERGVGASLVWNDPDLGNGSFEIVEVEPLRTVRYRVSVQDGSMRTDGTFLLEPDAGGTLVTWREEGDFGRNPLMGYWARLMARAQGRELVKALARLDSLARTETAPAGSH
jgi:uncharacterized protein YndB with AHSA1/START domain